MKKVILGLLTVSAFGFLSVPAFAGDNAVIQETDLVNTQRGNGNSSSQRNYQLNNQRSHGDRGNSGVVQTHRGDSLQEGDNNFSRHHNRQENRTRSYR